MAAPVVTEAPADAEQLWREYGPYLRSLVAKYIPAQDVDDVLQYILGRIIERHIIEMYEPGKTVEYKGETKHVTFKAFISAIVVQYCRGQRDKYIRYSSRNVLIADRPQDDAGTTWAELFGGSWFDDYSHLDAEEFVSRMRAYLALMPGPLEGVSLLALFDELVREVRTSGAVSMQEVSSRLGVTGTVVRGLVKELRTALSDAPEAAPAPSWVIGGVKLGAPEVAAAIAVLEAAKGIMVQQPLASAGHPLAKAAKGWYHQFSKEEIKLHPAIAIDPQTHKKPAGHVKVAVLHRLHRLLAEASNNAGLTPQSESASAIAAPPPYNLSDASEFSSAAEPDSPWDLIEFEVRKLGATNDVVDKVLGLVQQLVQPCPA